MPFQIPKTEIPSGARQALQLPAQDLGSLSRAAIDLGAAQPPMDSASSETVAAQIERPWREILKRSIRDGGRLRQIFGLPSVDPEAERAAEESFSTLVPEPFLARIHPDNPADPILRQVLPQSEEVVAAEGFGPDPLEERIAEKALPILRKYHGRCLVLATPRCAVHCRFCFRREQQFEGALGHQHIEQAVLREIAEDRSLSEVILSGGDPLVLPDQVLARFVFGLAKIAHVRRLRIHTRIPIVLPQRITDELVLLLRGTRLVPWIVLHVNHAQEIDPEVEKAVARLVDSGVPLLSQTVLLRGINDRAEDLAELFERLVDLRVTPYYLHQLDCVSGTAHYWVPIEEGRQIVNRLRERLPAYAVPRYVQEIPGESFKRILD